MTTIERITRRKKKTLERERKNAYGRRLVSQPRVTERVRADTYPGLLTVPQAQSELPPQAVCLHHGGSTAAANHPGN